ncbi:MAG: TolC family outer membrane protein [Gammaproteobacteria bacterium]
MKKRLATLLMISSLGWWQIAQAEDLMEVFDQAVQFDPTFKQAQAQWLATQELVPITRGALLPFISATGSVTRTRTHVEFDSPIIPDQTSTGTASQYQINAGQTLFNYKSWAQLQNAKAQAKQAFATYNAAAQNLMVRVANAYFAVLQAYDTLQATEATKRSLGHQLQQTEQQYKVGLVPITNVQQVRASYDATAASEIANQNAVSDRLEELRGMTGVFYTCLAGINIQVPLVEPQPRNINDWVIIASKQNYNYQASRYATQAARENVKVQRAGHFPTVNTVANYAYYNLGGGSNDTPLNDTVPGIVSPGSISIASVGIQANLPIVQGGTVVAQTRQAAYQYAEAAAQMQQTYLSTLQQTRESYLGVISGISKIQADKQSLVSNQSSLSSTKSSYTAGTATIVDVLQQHTNLYSAMTSYSADQYNYILSTLNLKQAAGTLCVKDLAIINCWLNKHIDLSRFDFNRVPPDCIACTKPRNP